MPELHKKFSKGYGYKVGLYTRKCRCPRVCALCIFWSCLLPVGTKGLSQAKISKRRTRNSLISPSIYLYLSPPLTFAGFLHTTSGLQDPCLLRPNLLITSRDPSRFAVFRHSYD